MELLCYLPDEKCTRILRRAGELSASIDAFPQLRLAALEDFLVPVVTSSLNISLESHSGSAKIMPSDVLRGLESCSIPALERKLIVYGYGGVIGEEGFLLAESIRSVLRDINPALNLTEVVVGALNDMITSAAVRLIETAWGLVNKETSDAGSYERLKVGELFNGSWCSKLLHESQSSSASSIKDVITDTLMASAVHSMMQGSALDQYATIEGKKAVDRWTTTNSNSNAAVDVMMLLEVHYLLSKHPQLTEITQHLTVKAMVYLSGVLHFLLQEILELTSQTCQSFSTHQHDIVPEHLMLTIRGDPELVAVFPGIIRGGGVLPTIAWSNEYPGQSYTTPVFDINVLHDWFRQMVIDLVKEKHQIMTDEVMFTREASDLLQEVLEYVLIALLWKARERIGNHHQNRQAITGEDIRAIRQSP